MLEQSSATAKFTVWNTGNRNNKFVFNDNQVHVEIDGLGIVSINRTGEGVIIDVFDKAQSNDSIASLAVRESEFSECFADELQKEIEKFDPSIDLDAEDAINAYDNNQSTCVFIQAYFTENEFDCSGLTPLKGEVKEFNEQVKDLQRPYIQITKAQYDALMEGTADFYQTKGGKVVTFDNADGGYALMPLNELAAEELLAKQSLLNAIFHQECFSDANVITFELLGWEQKLNHEVSSAIEKTVLIERNDPRGSLELGVKVNFHWEKSTLDMEIVKFDRGQFEKFDIAVNVSRPLHKVLEDYISHLNGLNRIDVEELELVGITEEFPDKWKELLVSVKALSDTLDIK